MAGPQQQTFTDVQPIPQQQTFNNVTPIDNSAPSSTLQLSNPSTVPNARLRNLPDPSDPTKTPLQNLYEGAKFGASVGSAPFMLDASLPMILRGALGAAVGSKAASLTAKTLGAGPFGQEVAGDVGGVAGGGIANVNPGSRVGRSVQALAKPAATTIEDLPVIGSFVKGAKALGKVRGELADIWAKQPEYPGAPEPAAPTPNLLKARSLLYGAQPGQDPAAGLGQIPVRPGAAGSMVQSVEQPPVSRGSLRQMVDQVGDQVGKSLNASPSPLATPKDPIYRRGGLSADMNSLPEGHTPVTSSAMKSYKYDPSAQEFHTRLNSGETTYVYGDVTPEEAQGFEQAESKGKGYQAIKGSHPLVAKIVNGKRVAVKPVTQ